MFYAAPLQALTHNQLTSQSTDAVTHVEQISPLMEEMLALLQNSMGQFDETINDKCIETYYALWNTFENHKTMTITEPQRALYVAEVKSQVRRDCSAITTYLRKKTDNVVAVRQYRLRSALIADLVNL